MAPSPRDATSNLECARANALVQSSGVQCRDDCVPVGALRARVVGGVDARGAESAGRGVTNVGQAVWDCDAAEHAMTASVRTAAAAAAAEPRQCTCRCLACASAGLHPNPRSNATCCFKSSELGGTGKPAAAFTATKSTTTAVRPADSTATAAVFIYPPSERDSLFFQRTLRAEAARLRRDAPTLCVEAFCGTAPLLGVLADRARQRDRLPRLVALAAPRLLQSAMQCHNQNQIAAAHRRQEQASDELMQSLDGAGSPQY